ncbi:hypothetical protein HYH02_006252 [Chlamydomonas schloesseri]|uniref:Protein kinase domain-containing protein n=1 Tax=Chlamydomonas schloesseri TaxID=2026947 RepID=A0A835WJM4_9CHLO|nr:hypothetical protein HYH02_006252 [Chlamydomonas schloesseri]|eukprot:KAG2448904.1 hypothetical protein HYH02_006252 [Chlamydomonas schloesseri]
MTTVDEPCNIIPLDVASPNGALASGPASGRGLGAGGAAIRRGFGTVSEPLQKYHDGSSDSERERVPWIPEGDEDEAVEPPTLAPFLLVDDPADPEATELGEFCESMLLSMQHRLKVDAELSSFRHMPSMMSGQLVRLSMGQTTVGAQPSGAALPTSGGITGLDLSRHERRVMGSFEPASRGASGSAGGPPRFQQASWTPDGSGQSGTTGAVNGSGGGGPHNPQAPLRKVPSRSNSAGAAMGAGAGAAGGRGAMLGRGNSSSQRRLRMRALLQHEGMATVLAAGSAAAAEPNGGGGGGGKQRAQSLGSDASGATSSPRQPVGLLSPGTRQGGYAVKDIKLVGAAACASAASSQEHLHHQRQQGDTGSAGQLVSDEHEAHDVGAEALPRGVTSWQDVLAMQQQPLPLPQQHQPSPQQQPDMDLVAVPTSDTPLQPLALQPHNHRQQHQAHANGHGSAAAAMLGARPVGGSGTVGGESSSTAGVSMQVEGMNWEVLPQHLAHLTPQQRQHLQQQQLGAATQRSSGAGSGVAAAAGALGQQQDSGASSGVLGQLGAVGPGGLPLHPPLPLPPHMDQYLVLSDVSPPQCQTQSAGTSGSGVDSEAARGSMAWGTPGSGSGVLAGAAGVTGRQPRSAARHGSSITAGISTASGRPLRPIPELAAAVTSHTEGQLQAQLQRSTPLSAVLSQSHADAVAAMAAAAAAVTASVNAATANSGAHALGPGTAAAAHRARQQSLQQQAPQPTSTQKQVRAQGRTSRTGGGHGFGLGLGDLATGSSSGDAAGGIATTTTTTTNTTKTMSPSIADRTSNAIRRKLLGVGRGGGGGGGEARAGSGHADAAQHALAAQGLTGRSASWYGGAPAAHADPSRVAPDRPVELRVCRTPRDLLDGIADLRPLEQPAEEEEGEAEIVVMEAAPRGARTARAASAVAVGLGRTRRDSTSVGGEAGRPHWQRPSSARGQRAHRASSAATPPVAAAAGGRGAGGGAGGGDGKPAAVGGWMAVTMAGVGSTRVGESTAAAGASAGGRCRSVLLQGRWQAGPVAVKVVVGAGLDPRNGCLGPALTAAAVRSTTLVRVFGVRLLPPGLAAAAAAAGGTMGFGAAALGSGGGGYGGASAAAAAAAAATLSPAAGLVSADARAASEALAALRPEAGEGVLVVVMELCGSGSLEPLTRAPLYSPFRPSRSWPAYLARRALLRTALEVAGALGRLHACGTAHGGLRPRNLLRVAAANDRRNFCVKVSDASLSVSSLQLAAATCAANAAARTHTRSSSNDRLNMLVVPTAASLNRQSGGPGGSTAASGPGGAGAGPGPTLTRASGAAGGGTRVPSSDAMPWFSARPVSNAAARVVRTGAGPPDAAAAVAAAGPDAEQQPAAVPARVQQAWGAPPPNHPQLPTSGGVSHLMSPSMLGAAAAAGLAPDTAAALAAPEALLCPQLEDLLYVAPEAQLEPAACLSTAAADAYAFGVLLWSLASGEQLPPELALAEPSARAAKVRAVLGAATARRQLQLQQQQGLGLGLGRLGDMERASTSSGRLQVPGLLAAPGWQAGPHGHLRALYEWCVSPVPDERPSMEQVVAELRLLDESIRSERPKSRAAAAAGYAAMTATSLTGASGGGGCGYSASEYMG